MAHDLLKRLGKANQPDPKEVQIDRKRDETKRRERERYSADFQRRRFYEVPRIEILVSFGTDVLVALEFFHTDALCDGLHLSAEILGLAWRTTP